MKKYVVAAVVLFMGLFAIVAIARRQPGTRSDATPALIDADAFPTVRAQVLLNQGNVEEAERLLRDHLKTKAGDQEARILLGQVLDFDGRPEEAASIWKEGVSGGAVDLALWMHIGQLRARQGSDGRTLTRRRGTTTANPDRDPAASGKFKQEKLQLAAEAYGKAVELAPQDPAAAVELARVHSEMNDHAKAAIVWRRLHEQDGKNADFALGLGQALLAAGQLDEAGGFLEKAIELNPRLAEAHKSLAAYYQAKGREAEAENSRRQAEFYGSLPPFTRLTYSEESRATRAGFGDPAVVERLCQDQSAEATEFLAALCWSHPHNELEELAFAALEKRGAAATPIVKRLLEHAQSTCTIRSSARILARQKDEGIFDYLVNLLARDTQPVFPMDIAGALEELGDVRAAPHLAQLLDTDDPIPAPGDRPESLLHDRTAAKARAALALGAFNTFESRQALEHGLNDPELAPFCAAAMYRLTRDKKHLPALRAALEGENKYITRVLADYLPKVRTSEAKALWEEWNKERQQDQEKGEKTDQR